jgi:predicted DNA-binding transcriptional regulator AlpA
VRDAPRVVKAEAPAAPQSADPMVEVIALLREIRELLAAGAPELLDRDAAGKLCSCSARHLERLVAEGLAPSPVRLGGLVRWVRSSLVAWIKNGCQPVRAAAPT